MSRRICAGLKRVRPRPPIVDRALLHLPNGKVITIESTSLSGQNTFLKDVQLNGRSLDRTYLAHEEPMNGGTLKFTFSTEQEAHWSRRNLHPPYSLTASR